LGARKMLPPLMSLERCDVTSHTPHRTGARSATVACFIRMKTACRLVAHDFEKSHTSPVNDPVFVQKLEAL
jgi:hypothetical protein